jgi:hypothetical protein
MTTIMMHGEEHVVVPLFSAEHRAIKLLAADLGHMRNACGLCKNNDFSEFRDPHLCCPTNTSYLVRADIYPILKLRAKP